MRTILYFEGEEYEMKNPAAVALGKRRWAKTTKAQRSAEMGEVAASISKKAARERALKAWKTKRSKRVPPAVDTGKQTA